MSLWLSQNYEKSISGCAPSTINQRTGIAYFWCAVRTLHFCQYCPYALLCGFSQAAGPEAEEEEPE